MAKIVKNVLVRESLSDIRNKFRGFAQNNLQEITPYGQSIDLDPSTVLGRILDISAEAKYDLEDIVEYLASNVDLDTAEGTKLDDLVFLGNVRRLGSTQSTVKLVVKAKPYTVIPQESYVKSNYTKNTFTTDYSITINSVQGESGVFGYDLNVVDTLSATSLYEFVWKRDSSPNTNIIVSVERGDADFSTFLTNLASLINQTTTQVSAEYSSQDGLLKIITTDFNEEVSLKLSNSQIVNVYQGVEATASLYGPITADSNTLTSIQTPVNGWLEVFNPFDADEGSDAQTDEELRDYYQVAKNFSGAATYNSMLANIYQVDGVKYATIRENKTSQSSSIPSHSFAVTVLGGRRDDVAQAIFENTPLGINSFGQDSGFATDINGNQVTVYFSRPEYVPVAIRMSLTQLSGFEESDFNEIRQKIIDYFNTFQVGSSVTYSRLYTPINSVPNHYVNSLEIGRIVNGVVEYSTSNIELDYNQIATINSENITFI